MVGYRTPSQKLTGDPGIFGTLGKILGGGLKLAGGLLPGPLGIPAKVVGGLISRPGTPSIQQRPTMPGGSVPRFMAPQETRTTRGQIAFGPVASGQRKRRRMDPMNVKALRRATRRLAAFDREKKKVEKQLRAIAPRPARRSARRDSPPGHTHVR
jgi:hypothetical protein